MSDQESGATSKVKSDLTPPVPEDGSDGNAPVEHLNVPDDSEKKNRSRSPSIAAPVSNAVEFKVHTQLSRLSMLTNIYEMCRDFHAETLDELDSQLQLLNNTWRAFAEDHESLSSSCKRAFLEHPYVTTGVYDQAFRPYLLAHTALNKLKAKIQQRQTDEMLARDTQRTESGPRYRGVLPEIKLPKFSGDFSAWASFRDLFDSMVLCNDELSNVEKLHYLKTSVSAPASQLISNIAMTNDSLDIAWQLLKKRYDDKERLILSYVENLFAQCSQPVNRTAEALHSLISTTKEKLDALSNMGVPVEHWNYVLIHLVSQCLDSSLREAWEVKRSSFQQPTKFEQLTEFIAARAKALEVVQNARTPTITSPSKPVSKPTSTFGRSAHHSSSTTTAPAQYPCDNCGGDHYIVTCPTFRDLSPVIRHAFVNSKRLCYNCFGHHNLAACNSTRTCKKNSFGRTAVLLATCQAQLITKLSTHPIRLLIDPGSELTFVSNHIVNTHGLVRQHSSIPISGIGGSQSTHTKGMTTLRLKSNYSSACIDISAHILSKLTNSLPSCFVRPQSWPHISALQLADPDFFIPGSIDVIIGADSYGLIIQPEILKYGPTDPIAQLTIFGWIILGPVLESDETINHSYHVTIDSSNQELQDLLTKFWTQEEISSPSEPQLTLEEQACENHFRTTHSRNEDGRYVVRIPLNAPSSTLGESSFIAQRRLRQLMTRLSANHSYGSLYKAFLKEYEELGHMRRAPSTESRPTHHHGLSTGGRDSGMTLAHDASASGGLRVSGDRSSVQAHVGTAYYLPHHGVLKEDSETTKLRVVFNGSSPTSSGFSLNDIQHVGAKIQKDISDVLMWIRRFKFVFTTDIKKMFRQIQVHPDDWDLQRIMWIDDQLNPAPYQLTTVTYGTRSAPFLAVRTVLQLVEDEGHRFPLAVEALRKGRYVDDIFGGSDQLTELFDTATQVTQLCMAGGFPLAKWHSNSRRFMEHISNHSSTKTEHSFEDSSTKLLGLSWIPHTDTFQFNSKSPCSSPKLNKRIILSETAQLYDPLGFLSPFVIRAKILLQELWLEKLSWDDPVSDKIATRWNAIRQELTDVSTISIPRWINLTEESTVELHGFSDASQLAMAAAIYIKTTNPGGCSKVALICGKTKVAPLKRMSIPRLELTAALLVAKLMRHVQKTLELTQATTFLWTDSSVALTWIKSHSSRWKDFVRNRVSSIQDLSPSSVWRYVPGKVNPADCASRGLSISQLRKHQLWWTGPQWVLSDHQLWPAQPTHQNSETHQEERPGLSLVVATTQPEYRWEMIYRFSSLIRLLRVTAICFRVSRIIKKLPQSTLSEQLTSQDIDESRVYWIKATQATFFSNEIKLIKSAQLPPTHPFNRLTPFIDTQGIIRVGGRLEHAQLGLATTHPAILPRYSKFSSLIIADAHKKTMHGGTQLTMNQIRSSYWIIGGRAPVRSHILRCIKCARQRGVRAQQLMGQLPAARITPARPFFTSGVDYAGPLTIQTWKGRGAKRQKGWLCIFVCFVTSAVHLEAVSDYTADAFLAAFRRFTGRRGICNTLHSDCGTNFVGADSVLKTLFTKGTQDSNNLFCSLASDGTTWRFNPPAAPHMGGKWEAAVKSVKYHLTRTIGETALTFEELITLLTQIEAILNSRPLEPLSDDPEDVAALTPAHFLIGEPLTAIPEPSLIDISTSRLSRWQLIQQRLQYFWSHWSKQYLQRHLSTSKWHHPTNVIKIGSLVLLTDERFPPSKWPLARVTQLHPGKDGLTRVVTLKTATTTLVRPISKLAILPAPDQETNEKI